MTTTKRARLIVLLSLLTVLVIRAGAAWGQPPDHRSFYMGFTSWPYDFTPEAVDETYDAIEAHGDLIAFHFDHGVPWPEAASGAPFHPNVQDELDGKLAEAHRFPAVYLAVTAQSTDRVSLANYWGEETDGHLPPEWQARAFDDPEVIAAYLAYCRRIIDFFNPDYFAYGIEVNANHLPDSPAFAAFETFVAEIYGGLKADFPELPIFLTFQTGSFVSTPDQQREVEEALVPYTDLIGLSTYPYLVGGLFRPDQADMSYLPEDWFRRMSQLAPDKPFAITETGYIAETLTIPEFLIDTEGREEWQDLYVRFLLQKAAQLNTEFITYWQVRDYDLGYQFLVDHGIDDPSFLIWKDIGLVAGDGRPRRGLSTWDSWLALPHIPIGAGPSFCDASAESLCLADDRFEVRVDWQNFAGNRGTGRVTPGATGNSGIFYFFNPDNWELMVKVLDGCALNDHFWVFAAATTNVAYTLTVRDTLTGAISSYSNALGTSSPAITDTQAFATCSSTLGPR